MDNLEEFLKGNDEPQVADTPNADPAPVDPAPVIADATPQADADAQAQQASQPRGPDGKFIPKGDTQPAEPAAEASPASPEPQLDHAALIGERRRRQEAEDRLRELEARLSQPPVQQQEPQGVPDRWEDPEGYDQWLTERITAAAEERAMHAVQQMRIHESAVRARAKHEDYDAAHATFGEMAQVNPALFQQMLAAPDPAEFAYQSAKREMEIRQYGSLDALIEARVKAALTQAQPPAQVTPAPIPDTLADAQSSRSSGGQSVSVPSLDQILGRSA